jgi:hypothetical protein
MKKGLRRVKYILRRMKKPLHFGLKIRKFAKKVRIWGNNQPENVDRTVRYPLFIVLRLEGVCGIEQASRFLPETYLPKKNAELA